MVSQQKRAWYGLVIGVIWTISIVVVFITKGGVTTYTEDSGMRLLMGGLFLGGIIAYSLMWFLTRGATMDERDRLILSRTPKIQLLAVMLSLAAWAIGLGEAYWDEGQIPVIFPYLILLSTVIVNILALNVGVLIGYWSTGRPTENESKG